MSEGMIVRKGGSKGIKLDYLYYEGEEFVPWETLKLGMNASVLTKEIDHLYLKSNQGTAGNREVSFITTNKIDVTNIDKLYITWSIDATTTSAGAHGLLGVASAKNTTYSVAHYMAYAEVLRSAFSDISTSVLDVSALSGEYYIEVLSNSATQSISSTIVKVYNVWGE